MKVMLHSMMSSGQNAIDILLSAQQCMTDNVVTGIISYMATAVSVQDMIN